MLQRAKVLVASHGSTLSQAAAMSAPDPDIAVHYPVLNDRPFLTIKRPSWKYHLADVNQNGIETFALPPDDLTYRMDWETDSDVQRAELARLVVKPPPVLLTYRINETVARFDNPDGFDTGRVCTPWNVSVDGWWTHNPEWIRTSWDEDRICFSRDPDGRGSFLRRLHQLQWEEGDCGVVHTRHMWSSGWGADIGNVADGLQYSLKTWRPFAITFDPQASQRWHYAAVKRDGSNPACETVDMNCYFLRMGKCRPGEIEHNPWVSDEESIQFKWLQDFATRPQQWLQRRIYEYIRDSAPEIRTPCVAIHVRRADVVLHDVTSRRYFPISSYLSAANVMEGSNVLLFTDDANAVDEALEFYPAYNWMYLNRKRHRGSEGGWENQLPSKDPISEVVVLLSIFELSKRCDMFAHTQSNFADMIYSAMVSTGRDIRRVIVDDDVAYVYNQNNSATEESLRKQLDARRKRNAPSSRALGRTS